MPAVILKRSLTAAGAMHKFSLTPFTYRRECTPRVVVINEKLEALNSGGKPDGVLGARRDERRGADQRGRRRRHSFARGSPRRSFANAALEWCSIDFLFLSTEGSVPEIQSFLSIEPETAAKIIREIDAKWRHKIDLSPHERLFKIILSMYAADGNLDLYSFSNTVGGDWHTLRAQSLGWLQLAGPLVCNRNQRAGPGPWDRVSTPRLCKHEKLNLFRDDRTLSRRRNAFND